MIVVAFAVVCKYKTKGEYDAMAKQLIAKNEYGLFANSEGTVMIDSRDIARAFDKAHRSVLRDIDKIVQAQPEFAMHNFVPCSYTDGRNKKQRCFSLTRNGFTFLVMGYNGDKADAFKIAYINRFDEMEQLLRTLQQARLDFPALTDRIAEMHDTPKPYHYSNEINMLYRIAIGMTASEFRKAHNLQADENIRPHLTNEQLVLVVWLQQLDCSLSYTLTDFHERKAALQKIVTKQQPPRSLVKRLTQKF